MSIEKAIQSALRDEVRKRGKNVDFLKKQRLVIEMRENGMLVTQSYNIAPLDTIGKRRFQSKK